MKKIGGFIELEIEQKSNIYHSSAIQLNTGRNSLELLLKTQTPKKVMIPYYSCESILEPIKKLGIQYEYYPINSSFIPKDLNLESTTAIIYINYYGICQDIVRLLGNKLGKNLIIDNTQAFFSPPINKVLGTFYSARKFFGVPDGGFLYHSKLRNVKLDQDESYSRCEHLLKRWDLGPEKAYEAFRKNEDKLSGQPIKKMSKLTQALLQGIDYQKAYDIRRKNFTYLHSFFETVNELTIDIENIGAPLCYPLLTIDGVRLKKKLIDKRIFIPTYWPEVKKIVTPNSYESYLANNLVSLPIDQRYSREDMEYIISTYKKIGKQKANKNS